MKKNLLQKLGIAVVLFSVLVSCMPVQSVQAAEKFRSTTTYTNGEYTFDKLSHSDKAVATPDGLVDYMGNGVVAASDQGQGDRGQSYSWSAVAYGDYVYVGTCYAAMGQTLTLMDSVLGDKFDKETMAAGLKAMFNGTFFYGQDDGVDSKGILVKVNVNTGETTLLMSYATTGQAPLFRNAVRYKDKLYFCGSVTTKASGSGLPSIYCVDPKTDEITEVYKGITPQEAGAAFKKGISTGIRGMAEYNGQLVVSCVGLNGPYIMISSDPSAGAASFKTIATNEDLFNYAAYHYTDSIYGGSIWEIVEFNGSLYVALCTGTPENKPDEHTMQSFAIVRGDEQGDGSWKWTPVVGNKDDGAKYTFGIDPERTRAGACNMVVYNDYLYIGEYEDIEIALEDVIFNKNVEFLAKNLEQSVSLYRMDKDENMELVMGDATTLFPNGGCSGMGSGFGKHENQYIWQSTVYDGKLYFGTFDSSSLLEPIGQFTNGDLLNMTEEEWKTQIDYLKVWLELLWAKDTDEENMQARDIATFADPSAYELVQNAIADANERYSEESSIASYDLGENGSEEITLSDEQIENLVNGIESGTIEIGSMNDELAGKMADINKELSVCTYQLNKQGTQEFADAYADIYQQYLDLSDLLPEDVKSLLDTILSVMKKDNLIAFGKVLKYLSTAERGFDMYVTSDGSNFTAITTNGFNDPYNHGLRVFATGEDWMVVGTANPFNGTQLWELREEPKADPEPTPNPEPTPLPTPDPNPGKGTGNTEVTDASKATKSAQKKTVDTGDRNNIILPCLLMAGAVFTIAGVGYQKRKRRK